MEEVCTEASLEVEACTGASSVVEEVCSSEVWRAEPESGA